MDSKGALTEESKVMVLDVEDKEPSSLFQERSISMLSLSSIEDSRTQSKAVGNVSDRFLI